MNYKAHMKISEYIKRPEFGVPVEVIDKIQVYHAHPMSYVRHLLGSPIWVSLNSGFRHEKHELEKGRTKLTTEHLFRDTGRPGSEKGLGAADYRTRLDMMGKMINLIERHTDYSRLCYYPNVNTPFAHCDYRFGNTKLAFYISKGGSWTQLSKDKLIEAVKM